MIKHMESILKDIKDDLYGTVNVLQAAQWTVDA